MTMGKAMSATTQSAAAAATTATYTASTGAVILGLSAHEFAAIVGVCIALLTFVINWWYKEQHLRLARQQAECGKNLQEGDV